MTFFVVSAMCVPLNGADEKLFEDFESEMYDGWEKTGDAFGPGPAQGTLPNQNPVSGYDGTGLVNSFSGGDETTGSLLSPVFVIEQPFISFKIGGGSHENRTCLDLWIDNRIARSATGDDNEELNWKSWDVSEFLGSQARLRILDDHRGGWGHINVDSITFSSSPKSQPTSTLTPESYRLSSEYFMEKWRPAIHFTPEINWMNDPNGMVWHDGEFHLFYQYNPYGHKWGHMSWGHSASTDLHTWSHLPVALVEEDGVMIFSGSAVVDHNNTSGLAPSGSAQPPMVAIYTGHYTELDHGLQNQHIAYSLDKGRTWNKYHQNPVLDRKMADFRDPKVIWNADWQQWIMVVAIPLERKVAFYASNNLRDWTLTSEFGPAGATEGIWECPDLFPLQDESGKTHWVLIVNFNPGAYAGGSGGQYFVGDFDGSTFTPSHPTESPRWLDFGRDFYATVTWSDVPESDGRRIALGWMSNWDYANDLPVSPWRSAMSLPREWTLDNQNGNVTLIQQTTRELAGLRTNGLHLNQADIRNINSQIRNASLKIQIPFEVTFSIVPDSTPDSSGTSQDFGIHFLCHNNQKTVLSFNNSQRTVTFDRTNSGVVDFHPKFPSSTTFPLDLNRSQKPDRIDVHAIVDHSSIEIFLNGGRQTLTHRVFPESISEPLEFFGGDSVRISHFSFWNLQKSMGLRNSD